MNSSRHFILVTALAVLSASSVRSAGVDLAGMDPKATPGEDFYAYANGAWLAATEIPADRSWWGLNAALAEDTKDRLRTLIEAAVLDPAHAGPNASLVATYYTAFMNEAAIDAAGLKPLEARLQAIAAIKDKTGLARMLGRTIRADVDPLNNTNFFTENFFGLWVAQGFDDPQHYTPYLLQGGLGLPDRAYYLAEDEGMADLRTKYRDHIATLLRLARYPEPKARAEKIFALEAKLARDHATREESVSVLRANNPWRREEFAAKAPGLDWAAFFDASGLTTPPSFIVWHPGAVAGAAALVASEPLETWQDYLVFHTLNQFASVLPRDFGEARFAFYETALAGTPQQAERWKRALDSADTALGGAVGEVYAAKYFSPASKVRVQAMIANLVRAFDIRIGRLEWMTPATKEQARAKLRNLYIGVGTPDKACDYTGLLIKPDDAAGNLIRAGEFAYRRRVALLGGPVDRTEWSVNPQVVDTLNLPMQNALNFPAAYLQPPHFDPEAPDAVNYAILGAIIGHEISHSFDDQGAQFDATGRLRDWWTPRDLAHFKASSAMLVAQYNAYRPFPDLGVNGQLTLSENIADLAGIAAAYDAFLAASAGKPQVTAGGLSANQQFFVAFAQSYRGKVRDGAYRWYLLNDGHAPFPYRVLTMRNLDAWYAAFDIKPGAALYLAPAARVRVW